MIMLKHGIKNFPAKLPDFQEICLLHLLNRAIVCSLSLILLVFANNCLISPRIGKDGEVM